MCVDVNVKRPKRGFIAVAASVRVLCSIMVLGPALFTKRRERLNQTPFEANDDN